MSDTPARPALTPEELVELLRDPIANQISTGVVSARLLTAADFIVRLTAENARLRAGIERYGVHDEECPHWSEAGCDCGFQRAQPRSTR
jgi:hypothetical protein